tara:strand:- start:63 stop:797 length:735 start_codon:yes stop_codon:yes gene_type:complete
MKPIITTSYFGTPPTHIHPCAHGFDNFFFTNNASIREQVEQKGWVYKEVSSLAPTPDYRLSSQQAKYIKFLQYFEEFPEFTSYSKIIHLDHKIPPSLNLINRAVELADGTPVLIRKHLCPDKLRIQDEITDALAQPRYAENMAQTCAWINSFAEENKITSLPSLKNTGFIYYNDIPSIQPMLDELYGLVWSLGQPECQILWMALSSKYKDLIQEVEVRDLLWEPPSDYGRRTYWPDVKTELYNN